MSGARCAWCGVPFDAHSVHLAGRWRCAHCGVATTCPWPDEETLAAAYADWYRPPSGRFSGPGDRVLKWSRGLLASRLDQITPPGPVLDVGAGDGSLLDAVKATGRDAVGLERVSDRPDVRTQPLSDLYGPFAAVVFWHSLEHLPAPTAALSDAARLLSPGGAIVVAIPNAASLQARIFGDRWFALDIPRHLVHIPAAALIGRLRALGLQVERVSFLRGGQSVFGWLHGLVGALPGHPSLYDAIRRPAAQQARALGARRVLTLAGAAALLPVAAMLAGIEAALRRGGTLYVEARRAAS